MSASGKALSVDADLDLAVDGAECRVWSEDDRVFVEAPSLSAARSLLSGVDVLPVDQGRVAGELAEAGLTVEVRVRRSPVARLGAGVQPSFVAERAGYDADVSLWGVVVAAWRALG
jgi:hypothetical protein